METTANDDILSRNGSVDAVVDYKMKPLKLGVEVTGIDLKKHTYDAKLFQRIKADAHRHRLMIFRNQGEIPAETFLSIAEHFGSVFNGSFDIMDHPKSPAREITRISNDANEGIREAGTSGWHIDGTYKDIPFSFLIFNAVKAPLNGDTRFVGHREVLESVSEVIIEQWDKLWSINTRNILGEKLFLVHPLIYNHPIVNEPVLCIHLGFMRGVIEDYGTKYKRFWTAEETEMLREQMTNEINKDDERLVYSHKWCDGDLIVIDNLQIAHMASKESQMPVDEVGLRVLHRVSVDGIQKPKKQTSLHEDADDDEDDI